jgi:hypothetical protein
MAIAFDTAVTGDAHAGYSHTCTGTNLGLFVGILTDGTVSGCTYNGVAMTLVASILGSPAGNSEYLFYLSNPATGAHTVQASGSTATQLAQSASYTGVSQTGQPEAFNTNTSPGSTSISASVTTITDNAWLVAFARTNPGSFSAGTNTTLRGVASSYNIFDSNAGQTPPGSFSLQATTGVSGEKAMIIASIAPPTVATRRSHLALLGVG